MSVPHIILASFLSLFQKWLKLVKIWRSSDKNNLAQCISFRSSICLDNVPILYQLPLLNKLECSTCWLNSWWLQFHDNSCWLHNRCRLLKWATCNIFPTLSWWRLSLLCQPLLWFLQDTTHHHTSPVPSLQHRLIALAFLVPDHPAMHVKH